MNAQTIWPQLRYADWRDTCTTLQLWTQIVGKIRVAQTPWLNHSWQCVLYVTARGLSTSPIPCGQRNLQIDFDFIGHQLLIQVDDGSQRTLPLRPQSVADFHAAVFATLDELGLPITIDGRLKEPLVNPCAGGMTPRKLAVRAAWRRAGWWSGQAARRGMRAFWASPMHSRSIGWARSVCPPSCVALA